MLASRLTYEEVLLIVYSTNKFFINQKARGGLKPLADLNPRALAAMTSISTRLGPLDNGDPHYSSSRTSQESGSILVPPDKLMIEEWKSIAMRLTKFIQGSLDLRFVCDVKTYATAKEIVAPILNFACLGGFSMRFSKSPDRKLQQLADETLRKVTHTGQSFPQYERLPEGAAPPCTRFN